MHRLGTWGRLGRAGAQGGARTARALVVAAASIALGACASKSQSTAGTVPADAASSGADRDATISVMTKVAQYEIGQLGGQADNDWINAVLYTGLVAAYRTTQDASL